MSQLNRFFEFPEGSAFGGFFVVGIQWETARYHAISGGCGTVAKGSAEFAFGRFALLEYIYGQIGIGQHHTPQTDKIYLAIAHERLGNVGQKFLEVGISRTDDEQIGKFFLICAVMPT